MSDNDARRIVGATWHERIVECESLCGTGQFGSDRRTFGQHPPGLCFGERQRPIKQLVEACQRAGSDDVKCLARHRFDPPMFDMDLIGQRQFDDCCSQERAFFGN